MLIAEFGPYFVSSITREMVGAFRTKRLQTPALLAGRLRKPVPKNTSSRVKPGRVVDKPRMLSAQSVIHELKCRRNVSRICRIVTPLIGIRLDRKKR